MSHIFCKLQGIDEKGRSEIPFPKATTTRQFRFVSQVSMGIDYGGH